MLFQAIEESVLQQYEIVSLYIMLELIQLHLD